MMNSNMALMAMALSLAGLLVAVAVNSIKLGRLVGIMEAHLESLRRIEGHMVSEEICKERMRSAAAETGHLQASIEHLDQRLAAAVPRA